MSAFSQVQKEFLEDLFTKLNNTLNEKTSEIRQEIKEKADELKEEVKANLSGLETKVNILEQKNKKLTEDILRLERKVRKNNIAVFGVEESETDLLQVVCDIFANNLEINVEKSDINDTYRIGNNKSNKLPIIVEFISYQKKIAVLKNTKKLKGSGISISSDLCFEDRRDNKVLVKHLKKARSKGATAYLKGGKLYVSGEAYSIQDLEQEVELEQEEQRETETNYRPESAPPTPDPFTRKRQLEAEEDEEKEGQNKQENRKKNKRSR